MAELSTPPPIGIDLGTTHSRIGVWRNEWVEIIPNQQGIKTTPSCVAFTDTRRYIGEAAEHQATTNPCNTIFDMKRLIGKRFSSSNVQNDMELLPFRVVIGPGDRPMISVQYQGEEKQFSAMEISSIVLRKLRDIVEAFLGCPIKNAVIAVPACFNNSQRLATVQAGSIAGLNVMRIINEPTAAAIAYGVDNIETNYDGKKKKKKKNILIFDLGGGTLDVSILTMEKENYKVKATVGDPHLGGVDFDNQLIKHFIEEIKKEFEEKGLNLDLNPKAIAKLRTSCERTKRILSSVLETHIEIDSLLPDFDFYSCITRARFEELNKDLFERCIDIVEKCLIDAKMYRSSIHDVVVIGGSTRIPKVQEMLRDFFNGKELSMRINSDEAVACGAAIQATILSGLNDKVPDLVVQDIITHSLGIDIATHVFMIPRNTPIPTTEEVILSADQIELPIKVYEGEMTKIQDNDLLGELTLNNAVYFAPNGLIGRIVVCLNVDENGIFTTSVVDKMVGQREIHMIQITSDFMSRMSRKEIEKMAVDAEKLKLEEDKYKRKLETKNALETWLNYLSKSIMNDNMLKLAPACKKKINDVIGKTMQWLEKNPQVVGDEFDEQYREYMNCLDKTLAQAGILNFQRSPPPGAGTMTNSKTNYDTQIRQGHTTNTAGTRIYTKSEASNTTRHAMVPIFRYSGFIGDKFCSSGKQGVKTSRADS